MPMQDAQKTGVRALKERSALRCKGHPRFICLVEALTRVQLVVLRSSGTKTQKRVKNKGVYTRNQRHALFYGVELVLCMMKGQYFLFFGIRFSQSFNCIHQELLRNIFLTSLLSPHCHFRLHATNSNPIDSNTTRYMISFIISGCRKCGCSEILILLFPIILIVS